MDGVDFLALITLISNILYILLLPLLIWQIWTKKTQLLYFFRKHALLFSLLISAVATFGSLYFSEVRGFTPCKLCWYQRIFMYPLPIILMVAMWKKIKGVFFIILPLVLVGGLIAFNHYMLQINPSLFAPCSTDEAVSCAGRAFTHYGYITIPWMSFSAFFYIFSLAMLLLAEKQRAK